MRRIGMLVGLIIFSAWFFFSHAVSKKKFEQISVGMAEATARSILGSPLIVRQDSPDTTVLFYGGFFRLKWCDMEVYLREGSVATARHDH
jgi:hypothetical protein